MPELSSLLIDEVAEQGRVVSVPVSVSARTRVRYLNQGRADAVRKPPPPRRLRIDLPAVVAGLTQAYSNGPFESANTKVKFLKRQMYGRAGFALIRQRIPLA
ncbi:transposase [Dactylosporangium vinaceum]|uniref:Transposase IS204/IS1001/IS1096/IS1165 DDE domain-containing protein n=1 Tax=Dactylosporangium vinaceum TaxID=53362 RepID=A0ABV5MQT1_9ACTN|nr:transposase [Dactylosporangium vinaceum]